MFIRFLLIFILVLPIQLFAQDAFTVMGTITYNGKFPKDKVNIEAIFNGKTIGKTTPTTTGDFLLAIPTIKGKITIIITALPFQKFEQEIDVTSKTFSMGTVELLLKKDAKEKLEGVKISAEKPVAKVDVDKKVYNVGQDITAAGGTASDVLRNVPSLTVDPVDGNVAIRGNENILVLIDGRPSSLVGSDIATILQGIPASSIETVEVINNAGAKYDAQGKGGVLNIILKKDRKPGYNGNIGVNFGLPLRANANVGLNANFKKFNFFGNASTRYAETYIIDSTNRRNLFNDTTTLTSGYTTRNPFNGFVNLGMDYTINKYNKITISQNGFAALMQGDISTDLYIDTNYTNNITTINRTNDYTGRPRNTTTSFNYSYDKDKDNFKLDGSIGFSRYNRTSEFSTDTSIAGQGLVSTNNYQSIPVAGGNNNKTFTADYVRSISPKLKIEVGAKLVNFIFKSENNPILRKNNGPEVPVNGLKNKFNFTQNTYAAYTNIKTTLPAKISAQLGLRYEYFTYDGFVYQFNLPAKGKFSNLFPSLYLTKKTSEKSDITLSYVNRVNRPNFFQLIPYIDITNPQDTSIGNANLVPELIHATELTYTTSFGSKHTLFASIYYQYNSDLIQRYRKFYTNGYSINQPQNISNAATYGAEFNIKYYILPKWDASLNVNTFFNSINGSNLETGLTNQGWSGFAKLISNYKFKQVWDFQLTGNYQSAAIVAQGRTRPYGNVDVAIKRSLLKNSLTLTLSGNDIFNTIYQGTDYTVVNRFTQYNYRKPLTRQFTIGAQLRFMSKNMNPSDAKDRKMGKRGMQDEKKETKSRDENLKKDEKGGDDDNSNNK